MSKTAAWHSGGLFAFPQRTTAGSVSNTNATENSMQTQTKRKRKQKPHTYQVGKITFIVTPVYREEPEKTIHDVLLSLMKKDEETT
jgi:hypothetical protein